MFMLSLFFCIKWEFNEAFSDIYYLNLHVNHVINDIRLSIGLLKIEFDLLGVWYSCMTCVCRWHILTLKFFFWQLEKEIGNTESLSREELGRLVASRWTGEKTEQQNEEVSSSKDENENHGKQEEDSYEEEYNGYGSEDDEHRYDHDDGDNEDQIDDFGGEDHDDSRSSDKSDSDDDFDVSGL